LEGGVALRAQTVGSFAVYSRITGDEVTPRARKARALLAYLLSDPGKKKSKVRLAALLWGDREEAQARSSLRQVLLDLRRALNRSHEIILSDLEHIWLCAGRVREDCPDATGERKNAFEDLDHITPEFDDWLAGERTRRSSARVSQLKDEAESLLARGLGAESSQVIEQMRTLDAHNEDALRLGMEADFQQARPAAIVQRFETMAAGLKDELGVEPSSKSRALRDHFLSQVTVASLPPDFQAGALYDSAEQILKSGAWECDLVSGHLHWTPGTFALFGIPLGTSISRDEVLDQYEKGSRERLQNARARAIRDGSGFCLDVDVIRLDGTPIRLRINAVVETRNGSPIRIFGTKQQVRRRRERSALNFG
jgi:DNA-binding SARP family transcriptional activator